jgi:hypothetical protein
MPITVLRRALVITGRVIATLLSVLALILCAAALFLWVRGYIVVDIVERVDRTIVNGDMSTTTVRVSSGRGVVGVNGIRSWNPDVANVRRAGKQPPPDSRSRQYLHTGMSPDHLHLRNRTIWQKLGFNFHSGDASGPRYNAPPGRTEEWGFRLPYWLIVAATVVPSVRMLRRLRRSRRHFWVRRGLCGGCGYDIRASAGRCPECGEPIADRSSASTGVAT